MSAPKIYELLFRLEDYYWDRGKRPKPEQYEGLLKDTLVGKFGRIADYAMAAVFDAIVEEHPRGWGLPDVKVFTKAVRSLGRLEVMRPAGQAALPPSEQTTESERASIARNAGDLFEEARRWAREEVRKKGKNMTTYESWWLYEVEVLGEFKAMPPDWDTEQYLQLCTQKDTP